MSRPGVGIVCYICGRQYGSASIEIHQKQCKKLWIQQEMKKPKSERRPLPKAPDMSGAGGGMPVGGGGGGGGGGVCLTAHDMRNQAAFDAYNNNVRCQVLVA